MIARGPTKNHPEAIYYKGALFRGSAYLLSESLSTSEKIVYKKKKKGKKERKKEKQKERKATQILYTNFLPII